MLSPFKPSLQASLILALLSGACGLYYGHSFGAAKYENLQKKLNEAQGKVQVVEQVIMPTVYKDRIVYRDRIKKLEVEVPKIIEREVYRNVCMDEDGKDAFNGFMGVK